jgi:hypothetical protein
MIAPRKITSLALFFIATMTLMAQGPAPQEPQASSPSSPASGAAPPEAPENKGHELPPTDDPKEIVRRSVEADHHSWQLAQSYTCRQHEIEKKLGKHGEAKSTEIKTYDINFYYGQEYSRLIEKNDQPLSDEDRKKEDDKQEKFLAKLRDQSEEERAKHEAREKKQREERRAFLRDMVNAYDFTLAGNETINGADTWVIEATPRKDFHPTQPHADILSKIKGKIWIEKKEYNWVKAEAEATDTITFGLFLVRIHKGSRFSFQQLHLNDEVWLLQRYYVNGGARLALLKNEAIEAEGTFSNYQKFTTSSRMLPGAKEVPGEQERK